jgi:hypothetical protein
MTMRRPDRGVTLITNPGMPNKALQQNRGDVLRYGESIGCDLLKAAVRAWMPEPKPEQLWRVAKWCWLGILGVRKGREGNVNSEGRDSTSTGGT